MRLPNSQVYFGYPYQNQSTLLLVERIINKYECCDLISLLSIFNDNKNEKKNNYHLFTTQIYYFLFVQAKMIKVNSSTGNYIRRVLVIFEEFQAQLETEILCVGLSQAMKVTPSQSQNITLNLIPPKSCFIVNLLCTRGGDPQLCKLPNSLKWVFKSRWYIFDFSYIDFKKIFNQKF